MTLKDVVEILKNAKRIGQEKDEPVGVRYIQISDTLTNQMILALLDTLESINDDNETDSHNTYIRIWGEA